LENELRQVLGLPEGGDIVEAVTSLKVQSGELTIAAAKITDLEAKLAASEANASTSEQTLNEANAQKAVDGALQAGKILPKQTEWAKAYQLKDPEGFKAYLNMAERVGPDLTIKGSDTGAPDNTKLTEEESKVAAKMGVPEADILKFKEEHPDA